MNIRNESLNIAGQNSHYLQSPALDWDKTDFIEALVLGTTRARRIIAIKVNALQRDNIHPRIALAQDAWNRDRK